MNVEDEDELFVLLALLHNTTPSTFVLIALDPERAVSHHTEVESRLRDAQESHGNSECVASH